MTAKFWLDFSGRKWALIRRPNGGSVGRCWKDQTGLWHATTPNDEAVGATAKEALANLVGQTRRPPGRQARLVRPRLYLAYGSNLSFRVMRRRCPRAKPIEAMMLEEARLVFRDVADVELVAGWEVPAGLWSVTAKDEEALDAYEGLKHGTYVKVDVPIGRGETAFMYQMTATGRCPPPRSYADLLREGYADFGLDDRYLDEAIRRSRDEKELCPQTRARLRRRRRVN